MSKIIITGVDGSNTAATAAKKAATIAATFNGTLHIVAAYDLSTAKAFSRDADRLVAKAEADISRNEMSAKLATEEVAKDVSKDFPTLKIETHTVEGNPAEVLVYQAEELNADLVVVGNKRVQGPARILGSVARSVAAELKCDLYVANTH